VCVYVHVSQSAPAQGPVKKFVKEKREKRTDASLAKMWTLVCVCVCKYMYTYICIHTYVPICLSIYIYVCTYTCFFFFFRFVLFTYVNMCIHTYVPICLSIYMCVHIPPKGPHHKVGLGRKKIAHGSQANNVGARGVCVRVCVCVCVCACVCRCVWCVCRYERVFLT